MRRRATIERLRGDLASAHRDLWQLAEDLTCSRAHGRVLQAIVDRQDLTILALWSMIEKADQQADEAPSDCALESKGCRDGEPACTASYAEGCGAYVGAEEAKPPCPCQSDDCHECGYEEEEHDRVR